MKIRLTETELVKFINKIIHEQEYGSLIDNVPTSIGSNTTTKSKTTDSKSIILFKDQKETIKVNNQPYQIIDIKKQPNGTIQINFKGFSVTTDCTKISKNDTGFNYGNGQYYSNALLQQVKPNCK